MQAKTVLIWGITLSVIGIGATGFLQARDSQLRDRPLLPVYFDHRKHDAIACVDCHHNYLDDTGFESCYSCHKEDEEVQRDMEEHFHTLCKNCHIERHSQAEKAGPMRHCSGCHRTHPSQTLP